MKSLLLIQLRNPIYYLLPNEATPTFYELGNGSALMNPILQDAHQGTARVMFRAPSGELWFSSQMLTLRLDSDSELTSAHDVDGVVSSIPPFSRIHELIDRPLAKLRIASRQPGIGCMLVCYGSRSQTILSEEILQVEHGDRQWASSTVWGLGASYPTSVTQRHLKQLSDDSFMDYVHEGLLLDAFGAYEVEDFRSCLIHAAFAVEAAAGRWLADKHNTVLLERPAHLRIRDSQAHSQAPVLPKDDIWDHLSGISQNVCKHLFHLRPLYLARRSLLIEDESLYSRLNKLFVTRNSIVHSTPKPETYPHTRESAEEALETVVLVLSWFGLPADFILPNKRFLLTEAGLKTSKW